VTQLTNTSASRLIGLLGSAPRVPKPDGRDRLGYKLDCPCNFCSDLRLHDFGSRDVIRTRPSSTPGAVGAPWGDDRAAFAVAGMSWRSLSEPDPVMRMVYDRAASASIYPLAPDSYGTY